MFQEEKKRKGIEKIYIWSIMIMIWCVFVLVCVAIQCKRFTNNPSKIGFYIIMIEKSKTNDKIDSD